MYNDFFGLNRNPFELSPDPSFLCSTEKSKAALTSIMYAITNRKGFVVLTGDAGTGKTLIVRSLFECWKTQGITFANIFAPNLPPIDFLINATSDLGIKVTEVTKGNLLRAFYGFLVTQFQKGVTTVLVVDEAHQMPPAALEEIRMLTNVETNQQKLIQVLLVGQPELDTKLDSFELRQLKQRIAIRCRLEPLTEEEARHYVQHRLELAGATFQANAIFPRETVSVVYRYSSGIPRLINSICEQALITSCALQLRVVPAQVIEEVASLFRLAPAAGPEQAEKAFSPEDESYQAAPFFKTSARESPDTDTRFVNAGGGAPMQTQLPARAKTLYGRSRDDIPGVLHTERADPIPHRPWTTVHPRTTVYPDTNPATTASQGRRPESTQSSDLGTESVLLERIGTKLKAPEPATNQIAAAPPNPRATLRSKKPLRHIWLSQLRRRSAPILRASLFSAAAVAALTTAVIMARRQNGLVIAPHEDASAWRASPAGPTAALTQPAETSPATQSNDGAGIVPRQDASASNVSSAGPTAAPIQPAGTSSAIQLNDGSVGPVAAQRDGRTPKATEPEYLPPRMGTTKATPSPPVVMSPQASTVSEPPLLVGTQTDESAGNGSLGISGRGPTPLAQSTGGNLQPPKLVSSPPISASALARTGRMEGVAIVDALVDSTGKVTDMRVISGFPRLTQAAMDTLRTWKYEPARLNGEPIAMRVKVSINFSHP